MLSTDTCSILGNQASEAFATHGTMVLYSHTNILGFNSHYHLPKVPLHSQKAAWNFLFFQVFSLVELTTNYTFTYYRVLRCLASHFLLFKSVHRVAVLLALTTFRLSRHTRSNFKLLHHVWSKRSHRRNLCSSWLR